MKGKTFRGAGGFVVVLVLLAIMAMSFFLLTGAASTTSNVKISGNYNKTVDVFNIAEAGLARARPMLEGHALDELVTDYSTSPLIPATSFNGGTYEVTLKDNDDGDSNMTNDADGIIVVTSTGRNNQGGKVEIETHVQLIDEENPVDFPAAPGGGESAALLCGADVDLKRIGAAAIDGDDNDVPVGFLPCTGAGCNTSESSSNTYDVITEQHLDCTGCDTIDEQTNVGASANCDGWRGLYNQLAALSADAPGVQVLSGTGVSGSLNTCDNPKVFIINTSSPTFRLTGNTSLCGTLIVASNTTVEMVGTITIVGLVLMMGPYSNLAYTGETGTSNLIGKLVFDSTSVDAQKELSIKGNAKLKFSSDGMGFASQAINNANAGGGEDGSGALLTVAWEERY